MRVILPLLAVVLTGAQTLPPSPSSEVVYKAVAGDELKLHVYNPPGHAASARRAAVVFFFGGGWKTGSWEQFRQHCAHLALQGMVAIAADYRIQSKHQSTPFDSVTDARAALRWVRVNAATLGIDPRRIAAGGGSAGGHLAAAVAAIGSPEEQPNTLVLFNPVLDTTVFPGAGPKAREISPIHQLKKAVPTIVFHGTADTTVPFEQATRFCSRVTQLGGRCELIPAEHQAHGFFNYGRNGGEWYTKTLARAETFLRSLGYIPGK